MYTVLTTDMFVDLSILVFLLFHANNVQNVKKTFNGRTTKGRHT